MSRVPGLVPDAQACEESQLFSLQHGQVRSHPISAGVRRRGRYVMRRASHTTEPNTRGILAGKAIISGEVATSPEPKGVIDCRMGSTLRTRGNGGPALRAHG